MNLFVGMDIHLEKTMAHAMDNMGNDISRELISTNTKEIKRFLEGLPPGNITIAMEACGLWRGVYKQIKDLGYEIILTSPKRVKDITGKNKTDKNDAKTLADLLRTNYIPRIWIPDENILWLRDIARHYVKLSWVETSAKNRIKCRLVNKGYKYPKNLWNQDKEDKLKGLDDFPINQFLEIKQLVARHLKQMDRMVRDIGKGIEEVELLRSIYGIDYFSALLIYAEIGDINRFESLKHLHSYAGLVPGIHQSADKSHTVGHKFRNRYLKWILYVCSTIALKHEGPVRDTYYRVLKRKGNKCIARRAAARKMLTLAYGALKSRKPYSPLRTGQGHPQDITRL